MSARDDKPAEAVEQETPEAAAEPAEPDPGRTVAGGSSLRARLAAETRVAAEDRRGRGRSRAGARAGGAGSSGAEPQAAAPEPAAAAAEAPPVETPSVEEPPPAAPFSDAPPSPRRGDGPNPLVLIGIALVLGVLLAKIIDWRGHAHPR